MARSQKLMLQMAIMLVAVAVATPALAGVVMFKGKLRTGFGNTTNGDISNNALPVCAPLNGNVYGPNSFGTLEVQGFADQGTGANPTLAFDGFRPLLSAAAGTNKIGFAGGNGGAFPRYRASCLVFFPPFINPRLRSRTQFGGAGFPGAGGHLGLGEGFSRPHSEGGFLNSTAASAQQTVPFYGTGTANKGTQRATKGANGYGGGLPQMTKGPAIWAAATAWDQAGPINSIQSGPGVNLGLNLATVNGAGDPLATYGVVSYVNGYLPTGPNALGGEGGTFRTAADPERLKQFGRQSSHTASGSNRYAFRTPGTALGASGVVKTLGGGLPALSSVQIRIAANVFTTGMVQHQDAIGDYTTTRNATGADVTGLTGQPSGTTRQLQVVTPWSAAIGGTTGYGIFPLTLGFGGVSILDVDIIPMPEPGALLSLGAGALALVGMARVRGRRN